MGSNQVSFSDNLYKSPDQPEEVKQDALFMFREILAPVVKTNLSESWDDLKQIMGRGTTVDQFAQLSTNALLAREKAR